MDRADVVIIGAGLAGTSLAWHLAGRCSVVVLEQGSQPCAEASAQNAGMVRRLVASATERARACRSFDALRAAQDHPDWREFAPFRRTGAVVALAADAGPLPAAAAALATQGVAVDDVVGTRLATIAPAMRGAPVTRAFHLPDEGTCDAWSLGQGFVRGALARGARFEFETPVTGLRRVGDRIVGVESTRGALAAGTVVLAAGAWNARIAATARIPCPLTPRARHLLQSVPHPLATRAHPWCWIDDVGIYVRPEAGGFLCSPCDETDRDPPPGPGSAGAVDPLGRALAIEKLERYLPALDGLRFRGGWTGLRTFAPDREPLLGPDAMHPGLFWLGGLGGAGVTCAFALGNDAAQQLTA